MHVFFSGIGGTAIGPLAQIAKKAGYTVSGSDKQDSRYIKYLRSQGLDQIHIGQTAEQLANVHIHRPIDWYVYSSAVKLEQVDPPELRFAESHGIKTSKRDQFLNHIIEEKKLKLLAVAGTHGKTTTTTMLVWLLKQLKIPVTYSAGAKVPFGDMGEFDPDAEYFALEADEFDGNFLAFHPFMSLITGVDWDHHEIFPTREAYDQAFRDFLQQSSWQIMWQPDADHLHIPATRYLTELNPHDDMLAQFTLIGEVNRQNAWLVVNAVHQLTNTPITDLIPHMNRFPGLSRRFERLADNLYTDYAHTEAKIRGALQTAFELRARTRERTDLSQSTTSTPVQHELKNDVKGRTFHKGGKVPGVVVVYEPLTNRRQHYIKDAYRDLFTGVKKLYWVPSYLAREDPKQHVLTPAELINMMANKDIAEPAELNSELKTRIQEHQAAGDLVVCISGGGGGSLDEWTRQNFSA